MIGTSAGQLLKIANSSDLAGGLSPENVAEAIKFVVLGSGFSHIH